MQMINDISEFHRLFVALILTHGRADNMLTYNTLRRCGYTGRIVLVLDNEDETLDRYYELYGKENCYVFDKAKYIACSDKIVGGSNKCILFARNACFDIAKELGYRYFIELDDDYSEFQYKFDSKGNFHYSLVKNLDRIFQIFLEYYINTPAISCLAMAQGGDFIGGANNKAVQKNEKSKRKAMNTLICSIDRRFEFKGRVNDDVNTYVRLSRQGKLFLTVLLVAIIQRMTQKGRGGMTEAYREEGTWIKSFSSIVVAPSCVRIAMIGTKERRIHHKVLWEKAAPKILNPKYKKL